MRQAGNIGDNITFVALKRGLIATIENGLGCWDGIMRKLVSSSRLKAANILKFDTLSALRRVMSMLHFKI